MTGGGSETVQSNQPPQYIQDQHRTNLDIGNILGDRPYQPYTGPRIADWTADQTSAFNTMRGTAGAWGTNLGAADKATLGVMQAPTTTITAPRSTATPIAGQWGNLSQDQRNQVARMFGYQGEASGGNFARYLDADPTKRAAFDRQMQAGQFEGMPAPTMDRSSVRDVTAGKFTDADLSAYMNPYTSEVINTSLADLSRQNDQVNAATRARAAAAGAFGGSRAALMETENNRNYLDTAARTAAGLRQQGFNTAQQAIAADQNRALQAAGMNQGMDYQVGALGMDMAKFDASQQLQAALANQNAGLQGRNQQLSAAQQLAGLGQLRTNLGFGDAAALLGIGQQQQGMNQANLDLAYQDFLRQQGYPVDQLQLRNGLLAGPVGSTTTSSTSTDNTGQVVGSGMMAAATIAAAFM